MKTLMKDYSINVFLRNLFSRFFRAGLILLSTQWQFARTGHKNYPKRQYNNTLPLLKGLNFKAVGLKNILIYFQFISNFINFAIFKFLFHQSHHKRKINTSQPAVS
ncbi:MAG: hypothetical protein PHY16_19495 [Methylobacter sp.]|nr:hypothetical protein [Methylobacter sp.]